MAAEEFAKLFYAMNFVFELATEHLGLSKKAAVVLWLLAEAEHGSLTNRLLVQRFGAWNMSRTRAGASRDVSLANKELDENGLITMHVGPKRVQISPDGWDAFKKFREQLSRVLEEPGTTSEQRKVISELILAQPLRKPLDRQRTFADDFEPTATDE